MSTGILLTGKRGDGKSLAAVGRIQEYLQQGRAIATNLDLFVDRLLPPDNSTSRIYRLPDHPKPFDFENLPLGNHTKDEEKNGLLVLDEAATFLNSRTWNENGKDRQSIISWLLHSRKFGWDLIFIVQHQSLLDKQLREALFEFHGVCKRMDKVAIPFITPLFKIFEVKVRPPKIHLAIIRYGLAADAPVSDRWLYRGQNLYHAYDTNQIIDPDRSPGLHSLLTPWHIKGRHLSRFDMYKKILTTGLLIGLLLGFAFTFIAAKFMGYKRNNETSQTQIIKVEPDVRLSGFTVNGAYLIGTLSDGRTVETTEFSTGADGIKVKVGDKWYSNNPVSKK